MACSLRCESEPFLLCYLLLSSLYRRWRADAC
uniref:Uncharacterized protein n=1 Tax=Arundo donax TaxID=35708 RepID=A0A0A9BXG2_ARUDO